MAESDALQSIGGVTESLSEAECRRLLGCHTLGRVGITNGGLPLIVPVHYVYDDGVIVFRTGAGTKLRTATNGDVLAFEVDAYDTETGRGWSVMVTGRATVLTTGHRTDALSTLEHSPVDEHDHCVRLFCELVTGRVIDKALEH